MAKIFRTQKVKIDLETGKRVPIFDEHGVPVYHPEWRTRIKAANGKRLNIVLSTDKRQAQIEANMLESREQEIMRGLRLAPNQMNIVDHEIDEVLKEHLAWGKSRGGKRGRPWSKPHLEDKSSTLNWWLEMLKFKRMSEVPGCLARVESILTKVVETGRSPKYPGRKRGKKLSGKTQSTMVGYLSSFFNWCVKRRYLDANPIDDIGHFDCTPETIRRNLDADEIRRLLEAAPIVHRVLLEVGLCTGFRRMELRSLEVGHLDTVQNTLRIDAEHDKDRKLRHQPIPGTLVAALQEFIASGEAQRMYRRHYNRKDCTAQIPEQPLLFVPEHASRSLKRIAAKAGVAIITEEGKLDFHSLRVAYINMLIDSGEDIRVILELSRHTGAKMTALYSRVKDSRVDKAVENIGNLIIPHKEDDSCLG